MMPSRRWASSNGSIIPLVRARSRIVASDRILIFFPLSRFANLVSSVAKDLDSQAVVDRRTLRSWLSISRTVILRSLRLRLKIDLLRLPACPMQSDVSMQNWTCPRDTHRVMSVARAKMGAKMRSVVIFGAALLASCAPSYDEVLPAPEQGVVESDGAALDVAGRQHRVASFRARVLVLKRKDYERDLIRDPMSEFAPHDMVMAWGRAGLLAGREGVSLAQGRRRYGWRAGPEAWGKPDVRSFGENTANWHLIPADAQVAKQIERVDRGDLVSITGDLVTLELNNGALARSSTSRVDSGDGACEIIRVTSLEILDQ